MNTIKDECVIEIEINKSIFICHLKHVESQIDAKKYIEELKNQYSDATHNVSAYLVGKTAEAGHYDDDGEPSGTAGLPVLDVFRKNDITNFVCVVTRYFGGIKLGAGGLIRAYSRSASEALKKLEIVPILKYTILKFTFNYPYMNNIELLLSSYEIIERSFTTNVTFSVKIPETDIDQVIKRLINITNNMITIYKNSSIIE